MKTCTKYDNLFPNKKKKNEEAITTFPPSSSMSSSHLPPHHKSMGEANLEHISKLQVFSVLDYYNNH